MDTPAPLRIALCDDTPALLAQEEALLRGALADLPHELVCCREGGALLPGGRCAAGGGGRAAL